MRLLIDVIEAKLIKVKEDSIAQVIVYNSGLFRHVTDKINDDICC